MKMRTVTSLLLVLSVVSIFNPLTSSAQDSPIYIYWADWVAQKVQRTNLDGSNVQDLVPAGLGNPVDIALDMAAGKMYWTDMDRWDHANPNGRTRVLRANLDGTNIETLFSEGPSPSWISTIKLDTTRGKMYWALINVANNESNIQCANLDGSNREILVTEVNALAGIALDLTDGKMYWTNAGANKIRRANLDGSNPEDVVTGLGSPYITALEFQGGKIYWTNWNPRKVQRANFDGSDVEDLIVSSSYPTGIALDSLNGKMYVASKVGSGVNFNGKIQRANLDGSNIEDIVTGLRHPIGIALGIPQTPILRFDPNVIADQTFRVNTPIEPLYLPPAEGGTEPYLYTLDPIPASLSFNAGTQVLSGVPTTVGDTVATYTATDATGASASLTFTIMVEVNLDVNGDGQVDVLDLVWVAVSYGMRGPALPADVNADGIVNIQDLVAVAAGIDAGTVLPTKIAEEVLLAAALDGVAGAPVIGFNTRSETLSGLTAYRNVANALADAKHLAIDDVRLGEGVALLETLLQVLAEMKAIPETTALLPNYPNPFNPETWIPYHLATDADVTLTIYDIRGVLVRALTLGHQSAGVYESRGRAAYWDGRNDLGEPVASGVYFYTLTAGEFTATRKLLIAK